MRSLIMMLLLGVGIAVSQNSSPSAPAKPQKADSNRSSDKSPSHNSNLAPPRSDSVNAASLGDDAGNSSSKDTQIDLSPPPDDTKEHPKSSDILTDEGSAGGGDTMEFHPWDPHKAAKDVEVGDYYFKRKNYAGAESRYREALLYKNNDAVATYKLAVCLEKMNRPDDALSEYESYLRILPYGPEAAEAKKAIERLKSPAASVKPN
ncbi:MAG TPA: tetratricopeptide repeat protein [Candidatus Udaeobacter sp.]|nr:tetratricopeptide repeat protein [Candidatus Udaeobacter sp.]